MRNATMAMMPWLLLLGGARAIAVDTEFVKQTYTYKKADDIEIKADVYRSNDTKVEPVVVWIHGGALLMGGREDVPRNLSDLCRKEGLILVSIDYRLMPQLKIPAIVEDVRDALRWVDTKGPDLLFGDAGKTGVSGGSVGGERALMSGVGMEERPRAVVSYWGFGDLAGDWITKPSSDYRSQVADRTLDEARESV